MNTFTNLIILIVFSALWSACSHEEAQPAIHISGVWQPVPNVKSKLWFLDQTGTQSIIGDSIGLETIDQSNAITGFVNLTDPNTNDELICQSNKYAVFLSFSKQYDANYYPQNVFLSIYKFGQLHSSPLQIPLSQLISIDTTYDSYELPLVRCFFCTNGYHNYYGSGIIDDDGNLYLGFDQETGYKSYSHGYRLHYYKFKITETSTDAVSVQLINHQLTGWLSTPSDVQLSNQGGQFLRKTSTLSTNPSTQLVKINMQGNDQELITVPYNIDNLFKIGATLYIVSSTSELWSLSDATNSLQKVKTLNTGEKSFFTNCAASQNNLPLTALVNAVPMIKTDINAKTDTVSNGILMDRFYRIGKRYFAVYSNSSSLLYSDNPFIYKR